MPKNKRLTKIIVGLLLLGCSDPMPPDPSDLHRSFCTDIAADQIPFIIDAMDEWNKKTNCTWTISENCNTIISTFSNDENYIGNTLHYQNNRIEIKDNIKNDLLRIVLLHELGHVAHLHHSENSFDIMYRNANNNQKHLTENDLEEFNKINWR